MTLFRIGYDVIMQDKIFEGSAVPVTYEATDLEYDIIAKTELQITIIHPQSLANRFFLCIKFHFAGGRVEPLNVCICEYGILHRVSSIWLSLLVVAAAIGQPPNSSQ